VGFVVGRCHGQAGVGANASRHQHLDHRWQIHHRGDHASHPHDLAQSHVIVHAEHAANCDNVADHLATTHDCSPDNDVTHDHSHHDADNDDDDSTKRGRRWLLGFALSLRKF
jgi:hypothetical protein